MRYIISFNNGFLGSSSINRVRKLACSVFAVLATASPGSGSVFFGPSVTLRSLTFMDAHGMNCQVKTNYIHELLEITVISHELGQS